MWVEVNLSAGRLYEIELVPGAGGDALADPFFYGVYDSNGVLIQNTENDDGGAGISSALQFVTDVPGTFYLAAGGFGDATGQYRLELNDLGPLDDNRFDITIEFTTDDVPNYYIAAFEDAVERWEEIITGDLDYGFVEGYGFVDDILIEVAVQDIELTFEGVEQTILAISTVLDQRADALSGAGALPTYSRIVLNSEEIGVILNLDELAQNTIGRALGFGSLWEEFGLVRDIGGVATYVGVNALREMEELSDDLNGQNVLEDGEDGGLAAEYWNEEVLDNELMTSRVEVRRPEAGPAGFRPDNPISELTIAAMQDLGYQIDYGAADFFSLRPGALSFIVGGVGDDILASTAGNDTLDGGPGTDTAVYSGNQASYTLTLSPTATTITDRRADGNGTDTLIDLEFLDFDVDSFGGPFNLSIFGGPAGLEAAELESFIELYIAYFNRAPDAVGLNFWGTQFANGTTLEEMAILFVDQDETRAIYPPGTTNETFVETVYNNVLGRESDPDGFAFWVNELELGFSTRDQFILNLLNGVQPGNSDRVYLDSKVDIGAYFAVHKGMSDGANSALVMELFDGTQQSINDAVAAIDSFYADALDPNNGEFLMPLIGVLDDPFAVA